MSMTWASAPVTANDNTLRFANIAIDHVENASISTLKGQARQVREEVLRKETDASVPCLVLYASLCVEPCPSITLFAEANARDKQAIGP